MLFYSKYFSLHLRLKIITPVNADLLIQILEFHAKI